MVGININRWLWVLTLPGMVSCRTVSFKSYYFATRFDEHSSPPKAASPVKLHGYYINRDSPIPGDTSRYRVFFFFENGVACGSNGLSNYFSDAAILDLFVQNTKALSANDEVNKHHWSTYRVINDTLYLRVIGYNTAGGPRLLNSLPVTEYQAIVRDRTFLFFKRREFRENLLLGVIKNRDYQYNRVIPFVFEASSSKPDSLDNYAIRNQGAYSW